MAIYQWHLKALAERFPVLAVPLKAFGRHDPEEQGPCTYTCNVGALIIRIGSLGFHIIKK